ncbi:MAG: hypothetical protein QOE45_2955 [Frankiaceae bacterium]|jgi:hypothetical protein|nr:hypothetical protein [Frankiaceae bacterium]
MRGRAAWALAAAGLLVLPAPGRTAAPHGPRCVRMAVSPAFATDRTAFCLSWTNHAAMTEPVAGQPSYTYGTTDIGVFRTTDGARSWRRIESDLPWTSESALGGIAFSARYAVDHTFAVQLGDQGVWGTTDGGAHFTALDPLAVSVYRGSERLPGLLTSFATQTAAGTPQAFFAYFDYSISFAEQGTKPDPTRKTWNGNSALVPVTGGHLPALASPGPSWTGFQLSQTFGRGGRGYVVTNDANALWLCDDRLACGTLVAALPWTVRSLTILDAAGRDLAVVMSEYDKTATRNTMHVWRSRNGGATWAPWTAAERIVAPFNAANVRHRDNAASLDLSIGVEPAKHRRIVVRTAKSKAEGAPDTYDGRDIPPFEQVWVSEDAGATFVKTASGPAAFQPGRGSLPWNAPFGDAFFDVQPSELVVGAGGTVFTLARQETASERELDAGVYCSTAGRTWRHTC